MLDPQQRMEMGSQTRAQRIAEDQASRMRDRQPRDIAGERAYQEARLRYNPYAGMPAEDTSSINLNESHNAMMRNPPTFVSYNPYQDVERKEDPLAVNQWRGQQATRAQYPQGVPIAPEQTGFGALDRTVQDMLQQEQLDASRRRMMQQQGAAGFKKGGRAKGKMNVNIVIATGKGQQEPMGMPNAPVPMPKAMPVPPPMPPQGMPPMPPQGMPMPPMPPQGAGPMPRKNGGRTTHVIDHAAGGGLGRLEKIKAYGHKAGKVVGKK